MSERHNHSIFFITGSSRSGTTMLGRVLDRHTAVYTFPELHFLEQTCEPRDLLKEVSEPEALGMMDRLLGVVREGYLHYRKGGRYITGAEELLRRIERPLHPCKIFMGFLEQVSRQHGATISCDQTPRNVLYIEEILEAFPSARVVCMVRDPRAVLVSQKMKWKRRYLGASTIPFTESVRSWFNYHPYTITKLWLASVKRIERSQSHPRVLILRYEDVVSSPAEKIKLLCAFLQIPFEREMLDVPYVGSSSGHDDMHRNKGLTTDSIRADYTGALSAAELYLCEHMTAQFLPRYSYVPIFRRGFPLLALLWVAVSFPLKMGVALAFNWRRARNLRRAIARRLAD